MVNFEQLNAGWVYRYKSDFSVVNLNVSRQKYNHMLNDLNDRHYCKKPAWFNEVRVSKDLF